MSVIPRVSNERWPGDCECGHALTTHSLYTTAERCSACPCSDYRRSLFHWFLDMVGRS